MSRKKKEAVQGIIYILKSFVLILIFCIIPIFMSGYFSFTEYNIMNAPKFVGLDNYIKMFKDSYVTDAAKNTLLYVLMTVPVQTILALAFAAFLAAKMQNKKGEFLRSVMFIPVIASAVTAGTVWRIILNTDGGFMNSDLRPYFFCQLAGKYADIPVNYLYRSGMEKRRIFPCYLLCRYHGNPERPV